jgi:hypothetical protein
MKDILITNQGLETHLRYDPHSLVVLIANRVFTVSYAYNNLGETSKGTCKICGTKASQRKGTLFTFTEVKVMSVTSDYIEFTDTTVLTANEYVKEIYRGIVRAVRRLFAEVSPHCDTCTEQAYGETPEEITIWNSRSSHFKRLIEEEFKEKWDIPKKTT